MTEDMKRDIEKLKTDVSDLKSTNRTIVKTLVRIESRLDSIEDRMVTKDDHKVLLGRMDGFTAQLDDSRFDWAKHTVRLDDHELRLSRLEAKSKRH